MGCKFPKQFPKYNKGGKENRRAFYKFFGREDGLIKQGLANTLLMAPKMALVLSSWTQA